MLSDAEVGLRLPNKRRTFSILHVGFGELAFYELG
jgi:hypothetical protein